MKEKVWLVAKQCELCGHSMADHSIFPCVHCFECDVDCALDIIPKDEREKDGKLD